MYAPGDSIAAFLKHDFKPNRVLMSDARVNLSLEVVRKQEGTTLAVRVLRDINTRDALYCARCDFAGQWIVQEEQMLASRKMRVPKPWQFFHLPLNATPTLYRPGDARFLFEVVDGCLHAKVDVRAPAIFPCAGSLILTRHLEMSAGDRFGIRLGHEGAWFSTNPLLHNLISENPTFGATVGDAADLVLSYAAFPSEAATWDVHGVVNVEKARPVFPELYPEDADKFPAGTSWPYVMLLRGVTAGTPVRLARPPLMHDLAALSHTDCIAKSLHVAGALDKIGHVLLKQPPSPRSPGSVEEENAEDAEHAPDVARDESPPILSFVPDTRDERIMLAELFGAEARSSHEHG